MTTNESNSLLSALEAWRGIVCLTGGGGTETLLYHLAMLHPGLVGITSTVPIPSFPNRISAYQVITEEKLLPTLARAATEAHRLVAYAQPSVREGHLTGVSPSLIEATHRQGGFDVTLVKANGTQSGWPKTAIETAPIVPGGASTVISIIPTPILDQPSLKKLAHRKAAHPKASTGFQSDYLARLLASPTEGLNKVSKARVIPLVNIADGPAWEKQGIAAAEAALLLTERFDRVVLTCMSRGNPLVRVIRRSELRS